MHTPEPWEKVHELTEGTDGERWVIVHRTDNGDVRYLAQTMGTHIPELREENADNATMFAAAPSLLKAACIGWDALSVLLESIESTLTKEDRAGAHEAIDRLFKINEDLNGLIIKQEDTTT